MGFFPTNFRFDNPAQPDPICAELAGVTTVIKKVPVNSYLYDVSSRVILPRPSETMEDINDFFSL